MNFQPPEEDDPRDDAQRWEDAQRAAFEADAEPMGFDLTRFQCAAPEPWSEYANELTGHRWGGWLAALASAQPAPQGWRTIESAPKDGTEILLGRAANEDMDQNAISTPGYWQEGYEDGVDYMGVDDGFVDSQHQVFSGGRSFGAESHRYAPNQPTHWQPMPAAPALPLAGDGGHDA